MQKASKNEAQCVETATELGGTDFRKNCEIKLNSIQSEEFRESVVHINRKVRDSGKINAEGCKFKVNSPWNLELFEELLQDYEDKEIVKFMRYGWPINALNTDINHEIPNNQKGVTEIFHKVKAYMVDELQRKSVVGPFKHNPMGNEARFSPLGTRPKKDDPDKVRVILNLSHPYGEGNGSVNDSIPKNQYLGEDIDLKYPGIDHLVNIIWRKGRGVKIFKRDLTKAYRQIFIDFGSVHLVGYVFDGEFFFDLSLSMRMHISAYICQCITNSLIFIYRKQGSKGSTTLMT